LKICILENLLQGSINTAENTSQVVAAANVVQNHPSQCSESVRFATESEADERPNHFVRTNTPHPKELMKKKEMLKQRNSANLDQNRTNSENAGSINCTDSGLNPQQLPVIKPINNDSTSQEQTTTQSNETTKNSTASRQKSKDLISQSNIEDLNEKKTESSIQNNNNSMEKNENIEQEQEQKEEQEEENQSNNRKHVDFKLNFGSGVVIINENEVETSPSLPSSPNKLEDDLQNESLNQQQEQQTNENDTSIQSNTSGGQFRLRRRDTPHHLKGARVNSSTNKAQQLDPNEMKEILERYTATNNNNSSNSNLASPVLDNNKSLATKSKPASVYIPVNFKHDEIRKLIQLIIQINRQDGTGLGIRIAGGKGSNPYKEEDDGIFITRILPESPAKLTGLKVGDKLLKVNQTNLNDLTHQQAADALKEAVKQGSQLILNVLQELDLNKLFFIQIPSFNTNESEGTSSSSGFRINYNFNTHQQREVEIIFIADQKRYGQLSKGDILLQINGKNVDSMSEKDLNKFVLNSNNPNNVPEFDIKYLTIYRPFVEDQLNQEEATFEDDDTGSSSNQQQEQNGHKTQNGTNSNNLEESNNNNTTPNGSSHETTNGSLNGNMSSNNKKLNGHNQPPPPPQQIMNPPISSSTPLKKIMNGNSEEKEETKTATNGNGNDHHYDLEEIKIIKQNGAMGLSIVGGGNVACHPFGIEHPGIFISKIVPDGPASKTSLRVGDRILKVNGNCVQNLSHDDTVEELKKNSYEVVLYVSHDPQPKGMQEIILKRSYPDETIGIRINGGIENKSANLYDPTDEGIFVVNIINGTIAHKDGRLQVGTRIMEVSY